MRIDARVPTMRIASCASVGIADAQRLATLTADHGTLGDVLAYGFGCLR